MLRLHKIWNDLDSCSIQQLISCILTLWGVVVFWPFTNVFDSSLGFRAMQTLGNETEWGGIACLLGLMGLWALESDLAVVRVAVSFVSALMLLVMALMFAISSITSTGWIIWGVLSIYQWRTWARFRQGEECAYEFIDPPEGRDA